MPRGKQQSVLSRRALLAAAVGGGAVAALTSCTPTSRAAGDAGDAADASAVVRLSERSGPLRGGTRIVATGSGVAGARTVTVGGVSAAVASTGKDRIVFATPAAVDFVAGSAPVVLRAAGGAALGRSSFAYRAVDGVDRQLAYVLKYWRHYNPAWEALPDDDCVDFTSQALLQRGWTPQGDWTHSPDVLDSGVAWRGSTAFMDFMSEHPELGTPLSDDERAKVRVGDVVQFDWDRSGDRDHTGTVTRVTETEGKRQVFFAGHTDDSDYRSVDDAITKDHPGGIAYYWSLT